MPGVRRLADYIGINPNTISRAVRELRDEGYLKVELGRGTFVREDILEQKDNLGPEIATVVGEAFQRCLDLGSTPEEFVSAALTLAVSVARPTTADSELRAAFVECNEPVLHQYADDLREALDLPVGSVLLMDIRDRPELRRQLIENYDLVVTTLGHLPEVDALLGYPGHVYGISVGPYLNVLLEVLELPRSSTVAVICVSQDGAESMKEAILRTGIDLERVEVGNLENVELCSELLRAADAAIVSSFALKRVKNMIRPDSRLIQYHNALDRSGIAMLEEVIRRKRAEMGAVKQGIIQDILVDLT